MQTAKPFKKVPDILFGKETREIEKKNKAQVEMERQLGPGKYTWDKIQKIIPPRPFIRKQIKPLQRPKYQNTNGPDQMYTITKGEIGREGPKWKIKPPLQKSEQYLKTKQQEGKPPDFGTYDPDISFSSKFSASQPIKMHQKLLVDPEMTEKLKRPSPFHYFPQNKMLYPQHQRPQSCDTKKAKNINEQIVLQQNKILDEKKKRQTFEIPKVKRKQIKQLWMDRPLPKYAFCSYEKGKDKVRIL